MVAQELDSCNKTHDPVLHEAQKTRLRADVSDPNSPTDPAPDPAPDPVSAAAPPPKLRAPASGPHAELMARYQALLGYPIPNGAQEGAAAKWLLAKGYTVAQVEECYLAMKLQDFWSDKPLSLQNVKKNIGAYLAAHNGNQHPLPGVEPAPPPPGENEQAVTDRERQAVDEYMAEIRRRREAQAAARAARRSNAKH